MKITYLSHAGYLIESRDLKTRIVIDPWLYGGTYFDQAWLAWSYPGRIEEVTHPDFLLFTHQHKDHFNPLCVALFSKTTAVIVPETAGGSFRQTVLNFGFADVREISAAEPLKVGAFEVHSVRIHDQWEFLDETAYLLVEGNQAALFMADLWYLPESLLQRICRQFHVSFAAVPWGGSLQDLCIFPKGFHLETADDFYNYRMDTVSLNRKNDVYEFDAYLMVARSVEADILTLGGFGFGWITDGDDLVQPVPVNNGSNQEKFLHGLRDRRIRDKTQPMYPGDEFTPEEGLRKFPKSSSLNTSVTDSIRQMASVPKTAATHLDGKQICDAFLRKTACRINELRNASTLYQDQLATLLKASRQIEFQIVNNSKQVFLFEQNGDRFTMREVEKPTGAADIAYMPASVMTSLANDTGPCWTEAEFSGLVKVSDSGWAPYTVMRQLFY